MSDNTILNAIFRGALAGTIFSMAVLAIENFKDRDEVERDKKARDECEKARCQYETARVFYEAARGALNETAREEQGLEIMN